MIFFYFILGILFIIIINPILENLVAIVSAWAEYKIYTFALKVYQIKKEMGLDEGEEEQPSKKIPMGFHTDVVGYEIDTNEEWQEEYEDKYNVSRY